MAQGGDSAVVGSEFMGALSRKRALTFLATPARHMSYVESKFLVSPLLTLIILPYILP